MLGAVLFERDEVCCPDAAAGDHLPDLQVVHLGFKRGTASTQNLPKSVVALRLSSPTEHC
jgi:hypothetical protein